MKVLLVDDDEAIRQLVVITLENIFTDVDITECVNAKEAICILESDPYQELIICDYQMPGGNGTLLLNHVHENEIEIPFILHTSTWKEDIDFSFPFPESKPHYYFLEKGGDYLIIKQAISDVPAVSKSKYYKDFSDDYARIRIFYFWRFNKSLCDIYVRINEKKYVKIINKDDTYSPADIEKYANRNLEYLYIKKEDYEEFSTSIGNQPFLQYDESIETAEKVDRNIRLIQQMALSTGLSPTAVKMAEDTIEDIKGEIEGIKTIKNLLDLLEDQQNYLYDHATLMSYLCSFMCEKLGWNTRRSREKVVLAALFHDISLRDPELASVFYRTEERLDMFNETQKKLYYGHPQLSCELIHALEIDYPGLEKIILQHHERPDGSGFPRKIDSKSIGTLASLFIFIHEYVSLMFHFDFDPDKDELILEELENTYSYGHFAKVLEVFKKNFT
ncbi:MAG: response regulator [Oligoflexia bacterium]|nr:response regulator [Oligoflexia bacterium]